MGICVFLCLWAILQLCNLYQTVNNTNDSGPERYKWICSVDTGLLCIYLQFHFSIPCCLNISCLWILLWFSINIFLAPFLIHEFSRIFDRFLLCVWMNVMILPFQKLSCNSGTCKKADVKQTGLAWGVGTILDKGVEKASLRRWHLSRDVGAQVFNP